MASDSLEPKFRVLDVVDNNFDDEEGRGVVYAVRRYVDGTFGYLTGPLDPDDQPTGGIYSEDQLIATGETVAVESCWAGRFRHGEVIQIADSHPRERLRRQFGKIVSEIKADKRYAVVIGNIRGGETTYRYGEVAAKHLIRTGDRIPPLPVPRAVVTSRAGTNPNNERPSTSSTSSTRLSSTSDERPESARQLSPNRRSCRSAAIADRTWLAAQPT